MTDKLLLTGATGIIGKELTKYFLSNTSIPLVLLIHSKGKDLSSTEYVHSVLGLSPRDYGARIHLLNADITKKNLGLDSNKIKVCRDVNLAIHSAASTRFDLPIDDIRKINVQGTINTIQFLEKNTNLSKFAFISTAYTSGKRTGIIRETEMEHTAGFVNTYEQSKYEGEKAVQEYSKKVPIAIYRISTVIGDSKTGKVEHFTAPHHALRIMYLGLASMIPGNPNSYVDLIPGDVAAETISKLFLEHFKGNKVYHIIAGSEKSYTLKEILKKSYEYLKKHNPEWASRNYPLPTITTNEAFELFMMSVEQAGNPLFCKVLRVMKYFAYQLSYSKIFEQRGLLADLPDYQDKMPHIDTYYGKVVGYCLKTNWGRK